MKIELVVEYKDSLTGQTTIDRIDLGKDMPYHTRIDIADCDMHVVLDVRAVEIDQGVIRRYIGKTH